MTGAPGHEHAGGAGPDGTPRGYSPSLGPTVLMPPPTVAEAKARLLAFGELQARLAEHRASERKESIFGAAPWVAGAAALLGLLTGKRAKSSGAAGIVKWLVVTVAPLAIEFIGKRRRG